MTSLMVTGDVRSRNVVQVVSKSDRQFNTRTHFDKPILVSLQQSVQFCPEVSALGVSGHAFYAPTYFTSAIAAISTLAPSGNSMAPTANRA